MYYSALEIVDIAVRIEENGHIFYTDAAKSINDSEEVKKLFLQLAKKEIAHIEVFKKLGAKFEDEHLEFNREDENDYLQHSADTHIFQKKDSGAEMALKVKTAEDGLNVAYQFENESVDFYTKLLDFVSSNSKNIVKRIIEEEKEHAAEIKSYMKI